MSWFGETFGDSINSLKGQITKLTKDVLADDEDSNSGNKESDSELVKELQALSESKDLEIATLRNEFSQLHNQYKNQIEFLKNENKQLKSNLQCDKNQGDSLNCLQIEINQLKAERDHLNNCIDELQSEHETNLNQVISSRDKYKSELEELTRNYNDVKSKLEELSINQENCDALHDLKTNLGDENTVINSVNKKHGDSHLQVVEKPKEKTEAELELKKEIELVNDLKEQLNKASNEIDELKKEKRIIEEINKNISSENKNSLEKLNILEKKNTQLENQVEELTQSKEEFLKQKNEESENAKSINIQVDQLKLKLKNLLIKFEVSIEENVTSCDELVCLLENKLVGYRQQVQETDKKVKTVTDYFESEIKKLNDEKNSLKNEIQELSARHKQSEMNYQSDMLQNKKKLEEMVIKMNELELKHKQENLCHSQTDDVKRMEQEITKLLYISETKTKELEQLRLSKNSLEKELFDSKSLIENLKGQVLMFVEEKKKLEIELSDLKKKELDLSSQKIIELENVLSEVKLENSNLIEKNSELKSNIDELQKKVIETDSNVDQIKILEEELRKSVAAKAEVDKTCAQLENSKVTMMQEFENLKAKVIVKESSLNELMKSNAAFQDEINTLQAQNNEIQNLEKEISKWKNASIDLELQNQELVATVEVLKSENLQFKGELEDHKAGGKESSQLKQENTNLHETCQKLRSELEAKIQAEQLWRSIENEQKLKIQEQLIMLSEGEEEKKELKFRIQQFQEQMKMQIMQAQKVDNSKEAVLQHKRSKSDLCTESIPVSEVQQRAENSGEIKLLRETLEKEQNKYKELLKQFQEVSDEKASAKKEFERLKQHLIEVEDHYTEEAVENNNTIEDLKSKLIDAEEQLKNSSTLYISTKVRDNQHLEALQSQVRLMKTQRDDLQSKLSSAEDEVQKHKASLISLQIVLEQFQQDKERELEGAALKYEEQLQAAHSQFKDLEKEMEALRLQLSEAKNGLKAASRLGEQLEKKTQQVSDLDSTLAQSHKKVEELEQSLHLANQSNSAKVDKSLIKNLVLGYILASQADRKSQVLRIMASVLDLSQEERDKIGIDAPNSSWLSNILHPKSGVSANNESLSEAFIKFLENESRPQPQLKLLPEQVEASKPRPSSSSSSSSPKPLVVFSELMLPTFNSLNENESSVILKNVLKES